jgi:hypothetical protein
MAGQEHWQLAGSAPQLSMHCRSIAFSASYDAIDWILNLEPLMVICIALRPELIICW